MDTTVPTLAGRAGRFASACLALLCSLLLSACWGDSDDTDRFDSRARLSAVPAAQLSGPLAVEQVGGAGRQYPQLATQAELAANGYVEEEFFAQGQASRYATPALATGSVLSSGHPYKTRLIVRRPADPARFNGVVVVEWVNVTSGYNLDALWQGSAPFFMREGYAYVGVSAQSVGVHQAATGLVSWSPARYGTLDLTGGGAFPFADATLRDALQHDVFAQAAKAVAVPGAVDPLGGLPARRMLIAAGVSQSEGRLVSYHNSVDPLHQLFDGYYLFLGIGGTLRTDLPVKVLKINTENDVLLLGEGRARQADSEVLRTWEIAGASHVSFSSGAVRTPLLQRDGLPVADTSVCNQPALSRVSPGPVLNAGYPALVRWIADGVAPPSAPRISLSTVDTVSVAERDAAGNALGGIRLPAHEVPTAANTGLNAGPGFCRLFGSHQPFSAATLLGLYPSREAYVDAVTRSVQRNQAAGFLLAPDGAAIIEAARTAPVPN